MLSTTKTITTAIILFRCLRFLNMLYPGTFSLLCNLILNN
jgi:hypothetical protein